MQTRYSIAALQQIVSAIARAELLPRFADVTRSHKHDGSVVTEADLVVQQKIGAALQARWPGIALLGEEMTPHEQAALIAAGRSLWLLDPLDGTSNFAAGIPFFSTSLALIEDGKISVGLVYDPVRDECFAAQPGAGASLNGETLDSRDGGLSLRQAMGLIDFKRLSADLASRLASAPPYASQRSFGSIALDWCWLAARRAHVYLHGKQNLWDYAAGCLILQQAGGYSVTLDGDAVFVNSLAQRSAVAAADQRLFAEWVAWLNIPAGQSR